MFQILIGNVTAILLCHNLPAFYIKLYLNLIVDGLYQVMEDDLAEKKYKGEARSIIFVYADQK